MKRLRLLSLFSGIGGIDLAAQWAGIETVAFCEIDPFCQRVLRKHWPGLPIFPDIRLLTKEVLEGEGISRIDIVAGGFPCQPYSEAGNQKGEKDDRDLWPEMLRLICELRPPWVVGENVAGLDKCMALDKVLSDLEAIKYETAPPFEIPACAVGGFHKRMRVFIMANAGGIGRLTCEDVNQIFSKDVPPEKRESGWGSISFKRGNSGRVWPFPTAGIQRVADGVSSGMDRDRIKALGNSVMPQQIYPVLAAIAEIERFSLARYSTASDRRRRSPQA